MLRAALGRGGGDSELGSIRGEAMELLRPVEELLDDPALPGLLAARGPVTGRLETPRTPGYLGWRYGEVPGLRYGAAWRLDRCSGGVSGAVIVARCRLRRGLTELTLSEILTSDDPVGRDAGAELIDQVVRQVDPDYTAALAAPGTPERRLLRRAGFYPVPVGPRLTVRPLTDLEPDPRARDAWRVSVGDLELF
jgi:hypothetical protein